jgi:hypothetical protein
VFEPFEHCYFVNIYIIDAILGDELITNTEYIQRYEELLENKK